MAIGIATDAAIEYSDFFLMSGELAGIALAIRLSGRTYRTSRICSGPSATRP
jgi:cation transport ATPase